MGRNSAQRKQLRRKFRRRVAALAGVAMITGTTLVGIPVTKAQAAKAPTAPPGRGWHQHEHSWPSSDENQAWYQDGKIYYRSDNTQSRTEYTYQLDNPAAYVKDRAASIGFNSARATFTLRTITTRSALVEVRQLDTGKLYNVYLTRTYNSGWTITEVREL